MKITRLTRAQIKLFAGSLTPFALLFATVRLGSYFWPSANPWLVFLITLAVIAISYRITRRFTVPDAIRTVDPDFQGNYRQAVERLDDRTDVSLALRKADIIGFAVGMVAYAISVFIVF